MLPPKRSTRSVQIIAQDANDVPRQTTEHEKQRIVPPTPLPCLGDTSDAEIRPIHNTPRNGKSYNITRAESSQKKARRKLTTPQRIALERLASRGNHPSLEARRALSEELGLELKVISVWFQNKRRPTNKPQDTLSPDSNKNYRTLEVDRRSRKVLANVDSNGVPEGTTNKTSVNFPAASSASKNLQDEPKVLPAALHISPSSSLNGCRSELSSLEVASAPVGQQNKRPSLEWACLNDKRATKRTRTNDDAETYDQLGSFSKESQRSQRTDRNPRKSSPTIWKSNIPPPRFGNQSHEQPTHGAVVDYIDVAKKDILDVALALLQLKAQAHPRAAHGII